MNEACVNRSISEAEEGGVRKLKNAHTNPVLHNILATKMTLSGLFMMGLALPAASEGVVERLKAVC